VVTPRVEVEDAVVDFGAIRALDHVSLAVDPGKVLAVLGPSGSGKSTLLRAVTGLQPLDHGCVRIDGRDQAPIAVHERGVGLMFQDQALFPHRDVGGNVAFGLRMQGLARAAIERRVGELLELVGLPDAARRPVGELSGGEQQRVALARALAPEPKVLLLDEPLGALDRTLRERLAGDLRRLFTDTGLTVVAVTHDQAEAFALADRIAVMEDGAVLQSGPPVSVWERPVDRRVAVQLGHTNLVSAVVRGGVAATPWGPLPVAAGDGPADLLVRATGVVLDPDGPLPAEVRAATFQGSRTTLALAVDAGHPGAPLLRAEVPSHDAPRRDEPCRVRIEPAAVVVLAP
jgi:thiamine transport system ATP-binding protein